MAVTDNRNGAEFTRRDLWRGAVFCAALAARPRTVDAREGRSGPGPITVDTTLIRVDATDIHADQ